MMDPQRVLLVDDDALALRALEEIFHSAGMATCSVQSAQAAFAQATQMSPDLVIVDIVMPEVNGIQLIDQMRRRAEMRRAAMIGITAHRDPKYLLSAFSAGADDFMFKPITGEELLVRSRLAIQRRRAGNTVEPFGVGRRDLTAMFCDVRGFTSVAASLDPEWVVEMLNGIFEQLVQHITAWGGQVDKFMGDGLLALFGLAETGKPKELCAIQAALSMAQSMEEYSNDSLLLSGRRLAVGVGIATGEVVIAPVGAAVLKQVTAIGDAVNLASRLQGIAAESEVLICEQTYARVADSVLTQNAREVVIKGVSGPRIIHAVTGLKPDGWLA